MYGNPQIHTIGDVRLESPPHREDGFRLFYRDLIGLRELPADSDVSEPDGSEMVFQAHGRRLVVRMRVDAVPSAMRRRVVLLVDSLPDMRDRFEEHRIRTWLLEGMGVGDRRLQALDPGGNRVEMKQVHLL